MSRLFHKIVGDGPDLVLLHGWGLHSGIWQTALPELQCHYRVHLIDLPGFGQSDLPQGKFTLPALSDAVASVLPDGVQLLGWSMGGMVATDIAARYPRRVGRLILVASNPCFMAREDWPFAMPESTLKQFITQLLDNFEATLQRFLAIQSMGSHTQKEDLKQLKALVMAGGKPREAALAGGLQILRDVDLRPQLAMIQCPMLRIYGRLDSLVPRQVMPAVDKLCPHSPSVMFRKAAHAPFLSHHSTFWSLLPAFIEGKLTQGHLIEN